MYGVLKTVILPPSVFITLSLITISAALATRGALSRKFLMGAAFFLAALYVSSTQLAADLLMRTLEPAPLSVEAAKGAEAVVILSAGVRRFNPEYGGRLEADYMTTMRLRYGAHIHRLTGAPILVTGGKPRNSTASIGWTMQQTLVRDYGVDVKWVEGRAKNTHENARLTADILCPLGVRDIILVTDGWHIPRAKAEFERYGFTVRSGGTNFTNNPFKSLELRDVTPSHKGFSRMHYAVHEWLGRVWYGLTHQGKTGVCKPGS
ncbi:MAG: YdcF family protein [Pseudomonadota bacterium]